MKPRAQQGMTLIELMTTTLILMVMLVLVMGIFLAGQNSWLLSDVTIQIQEDLRKVLQRATVELRQTRLNQQFIFDGVGPGGSDAVRFSIPVICQSGGTLVDNNVDIAHWGAPLTWGCASSTCMDKDNNCSTVDYKFVEYRLNNNNQFVRDVLDPGLTLVRRDIIAEDVTNFQVSLSGSVMTLTASVQVMAGNRRVVNTSASVGVLLRN